MQQVQAVIDAGLVPLVVHHLSKVRFDLLWGGWGTQNTVAQLVEHFNGDRMVAGWSCIASRVTVLCP